MPDQGRMMSATPFNIPREPHGISESLYFSRSKQEDKEPSSMFGQSLLDSLALTICCNFNVCVDMLLGAESTITPVDSSVESSSRHSGRFIGCQPRAQDGLGPPLLQSMDNDSGNSKDQAAVPFTPVSSSLRNRANGAREHRQMHVSGWKSSDAELPKEPRLEEETTAFRKGVHPGRSFQPSVSAGESNVDDEWVVIDPERLRPRLENNEDVEDFEHV